MILVLPKIRARVTKKKSVPRNIYEDIFYIRPIEVKPILKGDIVIKGSDDIIRK